MWLTSVLIMPFNPFKHSSVYPNRGGITVLFHSKTWRPTGGNKNTPPIQLHPSCQHIILCHQPDIVKSYQEGLQLRTHQLKCIMSMKATLYPYL